jgi:hypothetical protein
LLNLLGNIYEGLGAEVQGEDLIALGNSVRQARGLVCGEPAPALPPPPFTGGQCPGVDYTVVTETVVNGSGQGQVTTIGPGPVDAGTERREDETGTFAFVEFSGPWSGGSNPGNEFTRILGSASDPNTVSLNVISVTRNDGLPDDCGDPSIGPPTYEPGDYTTNPTITYDDPAGGSPITINPDVTVTPVYIDGDGLINVPIIFNFEDGSSLFGDIVLSTGDIVFNIGGGTGPTTPTDDSPVPDDGGPDGDPADPGEEDEPRIIAVMCRTTAIASTARVGPIDQDGGAPELYIPRLGQVTFKCTIGGGRGVAWTQDIDIRYSVCVIPCPVSWGALGVAVTPMPGVSISFTPIRGKSRRTLALEAAGE